MTFNDKLQAYLQLTRFDKPVGIELLLWPTLWGVMLAAMGQAQQQGASAGLSSLKMLVIFALGAIFMRAAGCAINDFADRKVDGHVTRTKGRPLADGRLSAKEAIAAFLVLVLLSASLLCFLPIAVFYWSLGAVLLAFIYPFMKRFTHLPQVFLAAAFGWAIPMAYVAIQGAPDIWCWLLFVAYMCWTVAYDTQYAMADREDDLKIGVKSTAILFGRYDVIIVSLLQTLFLLIMGAVIWHYFAPTSLGLTPVFGLALVAMMFAKQNSACATRNAKACFQAFLANIWVGRYVFALIAIACLWTTFNG
ncbi:MULTISPECIES: 4-hydroxybenzoate octaprenyltransferase [unclassified Psychrobacter]|uniref:4-hydroxybenzoate octaprenyltransferase n=1 Tax=unclassified Psychrobacter TaxID=196806 RepID=UPI000ED0787E|nr:MULTISPECIES: 4-hydroxybenzoate octaprenyltransferase [unclassified Psychrobacter]MBE8609026.1 4-hydroxybenzoate octaprenyltransferase [Pseudomonas lundensis]HCI77252.1 4-hydroxybenzoate octaprenyltransferase [Psychrobacter sp.]